VIIANRLEVKCGTNEYQKAHTKTNKTTKRESLQFTGDEQLFALL
jgi:hypothetical protein